MPQPDDSYSVPPPSTQNSPKSGGETRTYHSATPIDDQTHDHVPEDISAIVHQAAMRFDRAWREVAVPNLKEFAPENGAARVAVLLELALIDMERRRAAGLPAPAAHYLKAFPELAANPRAVEELARAEAATVADRASGPAPYGYELQGELGAGGMGMVYRARQVRLNRIVALKVVGSGDRSRPEHLVRFLAEAEAAAAIDHPNVVRVFESGQHGGRPYMAMEYVEGGTLAGRLKSVGRIEPRGAAELVMKIARGVAAAHDMGIVHRDLKPGNVLLTAEGEPKVADFGLAKRLVGGAALTATEVVMGTPAYMAPEQAAARAKFVGSQADVWALGVILYECVCGKRPFFADTVSVLLSQIQSAEPAALVTVTGTVPRDLQSIVSKCLEKVPVDRYPTAGELADDLERFLTGRSVSVRRPWIGERVRRWVIRNPAPVAVIGVLMLGLVGTAIGAAYAIRAEQLRGAEGFARQQAEADAVLQKARAEQLLEASVGQEFLRGSPNPREVLGAINRATSAGLTITLQMRVDKARALLATMAAAESLAELQSLDTPDLPAELRPQVELLIGSLLLGSAEEERAVALIRKAAAVKGGLSAADREYAAGLVAPTTPDALRHFTAAYAIDPRHFDARLMACVTLFSLGRLNELERLAEVSSALVPDHPYFPLLLALGAGLAGDEKAAARHLADLSTRLPNVADFNLLKETVSVLPAVRRQMTQIGTQITAADFRLSFFLATTLHRVRERLSVNPGRRPGEFWGLRLPPAVQRGLRLLTSELCLWFREQDTKIWLGGFFGVPSDTPRRLGFSDPVGEATARKELATHPDGLLYVFFAWSKMGQAQKARNEKQADWRDRFAEAGKALEEAARMPGIFGVESSACDLSILYYTLAGFSKPEAPERPDYSRRAFDMYQLRRGMREPMMQQSYPAYIAAARDAKAYDYAWQILADWDRDYPNDRERFRARAWLCYLTKAYEPGLRCTEEYLGDGKSDLSPMVEMKDLQNRLREKLGLRPLAPAPKPVVAKQP